MKKNNNIHKAENFFKDRPFINGLILSGGESKRMGRDKGAICYHDKSQRSYLYDMLLPYCEAVFISCNANQANSIINLPKIIDSYPGFGPIGAILSAFKVNPNAAWLTIACDLPFLNKETICYLIEHRNHSGIATAFWNEEEKFPEPLATIWEPDAQPLLLNHLHQGFKSPRQVLNNFAIEFLQAPKPLALKNVNTSEEYLKALIMLKKQSGEKPAN